MPAVPFAKKLAWALLLMGAALRAQAQHEADTWYFGERAGFGFRSGAPRVLIDGQMTDYEASTVLSDPATGQLLLYSNGGQVWGRDHRVMPNGDALWGSLFPNSPNSTPSYATQGALLVPVPGDAAGYYLFTLKAGTKTSTSGPAASYASSLAYSLVDMRRHNGLGDVVPETKNQVLATGLTEKLTAVRHANGRDYWLICHEWLSDAFRVWPVTAAGVGLPARYAVGPVQPTDTVSTSFQEQVTGAIQASPDGRKLAYGVQTTTAAPAPFGLYDFDPATGAVSNFVNLGALRDAYSPCFSPDNSKLYIPNFSHAPDGNHYNGISQFDLRTGDAAAVAASGQSIIVGNPATNISATQVAQAIYLLQNGPDGRTYGASGYRSRGPDEQPGDDRNVFYVIGRPNARGFACQVHYQRFDFGGRDGTPSLPNFMQHYFNGLEPTPEVPGACDAAGAEVFPNPTADAFRVQLPGNCSQPYRLRLYNAVGQRVSGYDLNGTPGGAPVSVVSLAAGLYVVELRFGERVVRRKLIKY